MVKQSRTNELYVSRATVVDKCLSLQPIRHIQEALCLRTIRFKQLPSLHQALAQLGNRTLHHC